MNSLIDVNSHFNSQDSQKTLSLDKSSHNMMIATEIKKKPHFNLLVLNIKLNIIGYVQYQDPGASVLCNH